MDINAFFTPQAQDGNGKGHAHGTSGKMPAGTGLFAAVPGGADFMDMIFSRITSGESAENALISTDTNAQTPAEQALLETQESILSGITEDAVTAETNLEIPTNLLPLESVDGAPALLTMDTPTPALDETRTELARMIDGFLQGLPAENRPDVTFYPPGKLRAMMKDMNTHAPQLEEGTEGAENTSPALITSGFSPEELAAFFEELQEGLDAGETYIIGMVKILPPQAQRESIFMPRALLSAQKTATRETAATPASSGEPITTSSSDTLASQLNGLIVGEEGEEATSPSKASRGFEDVLRVLEDAQQKSAAKGHETSGLNKAIEALQKMSAGLSTVPGQGTGNNSAATELFWNNSGLWNEIFPDGMPWEMKGSPLDGGGMRPGLTNASGLSSLTSLTGNAPHAGTPHPATQSVAATLQKVAGNGESKAFTLRLDPPELGRVEVRMDFGKEKGMKAHMVIEKPETYMMLQRDSQVLERALQAAGLETGNGDLSFELAQDGNMFGQSGEHRGHDGERYGTGRSAPEEDELEIIETVMEWRIDPETGLTRYDIYA